MATQDPKTIAVVGSINIDLVMRTPRIPAAGETLVAEHFEQGFGGKGANQAVACARLSHKKPKPGSLPTPTNIAVTMHGAVAADAFGGPALAALEANGVKSLVHTLPCPPQTTGTALVLVDTHSGDNRILLHAGANGALTPQMARVPEGRPPAVVVLQLEVPVAVVEAAVAQVGAMNRSRGEGQPAVQVVLNTAPAPESGCAALDGLEWGSVGHLVMNETEAGMMGGVEVRADSGMEVFRGVAEGFVGRGVGCVVITLGARGVYYYRRAEVGGKQEVKGADEGLVAAHKANVVDTTAAGDTFVGAYAIQVAQAQGQAFDIAKACAIANWAAAKTVERRGAQESIPWLDEIGEMPQS